MSRKLSRQQERKEVFKKEILKALLIQPYKSIYALREDFGKRKNNEVKEFSRASYERYVKRLEGEGYLTTSQGGRGAKSLDLTFKGLVYLILHEKLGESDSRLIVERILGVSEYRKLELVKFAGIQQISIVSLAKGFDMIRSRVNLEHFDEEYVKQLFYEVVVIENMLNGISNWRKQHVSKKVSERKRKQQRIIATRSFDKMSSEYLQICSTLCDYLRAKITRLNNKLILVEPIVREFEKRRKNHR